MPIRASDLRKRLLQLGFEWTQGRGTSHHKIKGNGLARPVPIALHNGMREELPDLILKKLAKQLGLDDWETLKK